MTHRAQVKKEIIQNIDFKHSYYPRGTSAVLDLELPRLDNIKIHDCHQI